MFGSVKITNMAFAAGASVFLLLWAAVCGYNLDTKFPVIYKGGQFGDYFGFTVALHRNREGSLALVGAPRANSSFLPVHQPGVLYKCNIPNNNAQPKCSEVTLDTKGNTQTVQGSEFSYYDKKDDMWLGVSLDIQQDKAHNDIVTCGHLWKNQYYRSHHLANGVCYVINSDLDQSRVVKLAPLIQRSKQAIIPPGIYYYAFGQAGTSATFSEDGKHLLLGAPGIYDWVGSIVSYSSDSNNYQARYNSPIIPDPPFGLAPESYLGYSVTSGKFFDNSNIFYAVGAPRDSGNHGRVYIFKALEQKKNELVIHQKKEGTQFGEYFGASVLGVNLNGDSFTDLLIGAPFFSLETGGDEGKVYVYISNGVGLQAYAELMGSSKPNSRFGTAIANVGDLNQDGYNDIAVGAPYEDDKGAVYIYHGSENGMKVQYVQKIEAADISAQLSGFGIHISRGLDIDSNRYPDILVGSYASSNAVLFRTHPVIQLFPKLIFSPNQINMNLTTCEFGGKLQPCVNVTSCLWFMGKHLNIPLNFVNEIYVEHPSQTNRITPRGFFVQDGRQVAVIRENATLNIGVERCTSNLLHIHTDIKDIITPIQILYRFRLAEPADADRHFDKTFPVIDQNSPSNITSAVTFQTGCGREDKCLSDLVVNATLLGTAGRGELIIGEVSSISLSITVQNKGEPAYLAELFIILPPDTPSINQDFCTTSTQGNASLICDLGNPLLEKQAATFLIKLDVSKIPTDRKVLDIFLEARTVSTEIKPENNERRISLPLKAVAEIGITGISSQELILYDKDEEIELPVPIVHTYTVKNYGPSPLQVIDIILHVPVSFIRDNEKMKFLTFTSLEVDSGKQLTIPAKCNDTYLDIKNVVPDVKQHRGQAFGEDDFVEEYNRNDTSKRHYNHSTDLLSGPSELVLDPNDDEVLVYRSKKSVDKKDVPKYKETVVLDCKTENVECVAIQCTASPFTDTRRIAQITVAAQVSLPVLNNYLGPWYRVKLVTSGHVSMRDSNVVLKNDVPDDAQVKTVFVHKGPLPSEELAWWIIIVSIAAGILLLLVILILLLRFGFFRREKKEQMQKILDAESNKDYEHLHEEPNEKDALNNI